jgi:hypothetical protein
VERLKISKKQPEKAARYVPVFNQAWIRASSGGRYTELKKNSRREFNELH